MGAPYTSVPVTNYNLNPPADDGSQVPANRITWAGQKTKLSDPLKTAIESINTGIGTAFGKIVGGSGVTATALSYGVGASDQGKLVNATASGITITTPDATDVGSPFVFGLLNSSTGNITLDGFSAQLVNGASSLVVPPGDGYLIWTDGANWLLIGRKTGILPRGYIDGCGTANGTDATNDINFSAGVCRDSSNFFDITCAAMVKQLDANWVAGTNQGMRNSAAGIANTTYHLYAVAKPDGTQDYYAHTSTVAATVLTALQAETGGSGYSYVRWIASIVRASSAIILYIQEGNFFRFKTIPATDISDGSATSGVAKTGTFTSAPNGVAMNVLVNTWSDQAALYICGTDQSDQGAAIAGSTPGATSYVNGQANGGQAIVRMDSSRQILYRPSNNGSVNICLLGFWHPRGTNA